MSLAGQTLSVVGAGKMAEAIIAGVLRHGLLPPERIVAATPRAERRAALEAAHGIRTLADNVQVAAEGDVMLLGIKPQSLPRVAPELAGRLKPTAVLVTMLAGVALRDVQAVLAHEAAVRVMPNLPARVGEGVTVWMPSAAATEPQRQQVAAMLQAIGEELQVEHEAYLDMATALSGTGPTYTFLLMEALIDAGVHLGFPRHIAQALVQRTILGSVRIAIEAESQHLAELRNAVTSPGGTSAAALYEMEKGGLRTVIADAVWAAYRRSQELGKANG